MHTWHTQHVKGKSYVINKDNIYVLYVYETRNLCMEFTLLALKCVKLYEYEAFAGISFCIDPISIIFMIESEPWENYIPIVCCW